MSIIHLIIICVVVGVVLWLINAYVPMQSQVRKVMNVAVPLLLVLWILFSVLGGLDLGSVRLD
jgi:uncharacterized protein with PQ loop repeat